MKALFDFGTAQKKRRITAKEAVRLNFYIDGLRFSEEFMLIPGLSKGIII
jgi:hypothetical protein